MDSFLAFNCNKRSVTADLKNPSVRDGPLRASAYFDVVVENFRPGVMARLGLGYEDFRARNPAIIYASSSGFGQDWPYAGRPGQDLLVQALTGATHLTDRRDDPPAAYDIGVADEHIGLHLVVAILAAVGHRQKTGEGQHVSVDLFSCTLAAQQELTVCLNHGKPLERAAEDVGHVGGTAPFGIYATTDGHIALAMTPCPQLGEALRVEWLAGYDTNTKMYEQRHDIYGRLQWLFGTQPTSCWLAILDRAGIWCAKAQDYTDVEADPQVAHNDLIWTVPVGEEGSGFPTIGTPFRFSRTPVRIRRDPRAGQHNHELFPSLGVNGTQP